MRKFETLNPPFLKNDLIDSFDFSPTERAPAKSSPRALSALTVVANTVQHNPIIITPIIIIVCYPIIVIGIKS